MSFEEVKNPIHAGETLLPARATKGSAGYDFHIKEDIVLEPNTVHVTWTDVKVKLVDWTFLGVFPRSSLGIKHGVVLANTVGIIDSDYYSNPDNDGNIGIALHNTGTETVYLNKGDKVAQGILLPYGTFKEEKISEQRTGGIGSTDRKGE